MIIVVSPAKTLNLEPLKPARIRTLAPSLPQFAGQAAELAGQLRGTSPSELQGLMAISEDLARLNAERFQRWSPDFPESQCKPAVLCFDGDVYDGLQAATLSTAQLRWADRHLRILSGLYGLLRPLDWMQPYRLEMGTRLRNARGRDLYAFWGTQLAEALAALLQAQAGPRKGRVLINLASEEYFKAVDTRALGHPVITPVFQDASGKGDFKVISFFAKRARGMMTRFIIEQGLKHPEPLKGFEAAGYRFDAQASDEQYWVFRRRL